MEDRKASLVAAAFGSVAIGGFWLARPVRPTAPLRVVEQWVPVVRHAADADLAVAFRVEFPAGFRAAQEMGQNLEYRIIDRTGNQYPLVPMADPSVSDGLKLTRGYVRRILSPRIAAFLNDEILSSVPVASLPLPERVVLAPKPNADLRLVYHPGGGIYAEPKRPLAHDERLRVTARRTPSSTSLSSVAFVAPRPDRPPSRRLYVPYASETPAVEVDIVRYKLVPRSEIVQIPDLRLESRYGGTALVVDNRATIPNTLDARIVLPVQDNGPRRTLRHEDPRVAFASLVVTRPQTGSPSPSSAPGRREIGPFLEILSPRPESLGLNEIRIGGAVRRAVDPPTGAVRNGTFRATVRVSYFRPVAVGSRRATIPVEQGDPVPRTRFFGGNWGSPASF